MYVMRISAALILSVISLGTTSLGAADLALSYSLEIVAGSSGVGDGDLAIHSPLGDAEGVAVDKKGNIFIADAIDNRIRVIAPTGIISTILGNGSPGPLTLPYGIATDGAGNVYVADLGNNRILRITPSGVVTTLLDHLASPRNVLVDIAGNLYFSEFAGHQVRKLSSDGSISVVAGTGLAGSDGDGGFATQARINAPAGLALDNAGNLYIADSGNHKVRRISAGRISTVLGTGVAGNTTANQLYSPTAVTIGLAGDLYIADAGNHRIRKLSTNGSISTIPGSGRDLAQAADGSLLAASGAQLLRILPSGALNPIAGDGTYRFRGDSGPATQARLNQPQGVAIDGAGNLWIADTANSRIRQVNARGIIQTVAGGDASLTAPSGLSLTPAGDLLVADISGHVIRQLLAGSGTVSSIAGTGSPGASGDGLPASVSQLYLPAGVAAGSSGGFYFADTGNHRVRRVYASGIVATVGGIGEAGFNGDGAGQGIALKNPAAVALDGNGNLYIADTGNNRIRKLTPDGWLTTVAGPGQLNQPRGVATDAAGNIWISDTGNHRVLVLSPGGTLGVVTDQLQAPAGLTVDSVTGSVYVADPAANRIIRLIPPPPSLIEGTPPIVVVNSATLLSGAVAPGTLLSIYGSGLSAVQVYFDGVTVPPVSLQDSQLNVQMPESATGELELRSSTATLLRTKLTIVPSAPGIFTIPGGTGPAVAANQDGSLNSMDHPAGSGDAVTFYATGIGRGSTVSVTIGGVPAGVLFAGDAPGLTGISQINVTVPQGLSAGQQPLQLQAGSGLTQAGVTLSIR